MKSLVFTSLIGGSSAIALALAATPAAAQTTPAAPPATTNSPAGVDQPDQQTATEQPTDSAGAPATGGEITVTGSRIRRVDFDTPNPIITLGAARIQESGTTNLTDFLSGYPAL